MEAMTFIDISSLQTGTFGTEVREWGKRRVKTQSRNQWKSIELAKAVHAARVVMKRLHTLAGLVACHFTRVGC